MTSDTKVVIGIGIATVAILGAIVAFGGSSAPGPSDPIKVEQGELVRPESPSTGPENAKVTIVEFADFQCPACGSAHPVLKQLMSEYSDRMRFVHRHFPLPMHANAELASLASEAAAAQGKFWEMHDKIFVAQNQWSSQTNPENTFVQYAQDVGLDVEAFRQALSDQKIIDRIRLDKGDGEALGVNATPTIYINGEKYDGSVSYAVMKQFIDQKLAE